MKIEIDNGSYEVREVKGKSEVFLTSRSGGVLTFEGVEYKNNDTILKKNVNDKVALNLLIDLGFVIK